MERFGFARADIILLSCVEDPTRILIYYTPYSFVDWKPVTNSIRGGRRSENLYGELGMYSGTLCTMTYIKRLLLPFYILSTFINSVQVPMYRLLTLTFGVRFILRRYEVLRTNSELGH